MIDNAKHCGIEIGSNHSEESRIQSDAYLVLMLTNIQVIWSDCPPNKRTDVGASQSVMVMWLLQFDFNEI